MADEPCTSKGAPSGRRNKFNAKFPPTRIKKVIQIDEEIGKMAGSVPALIGRSVELFAEQLLKKSVMVTNARDAKTLTPQHMKAAVLAEPVFAFLKDTFSKIPDVVSMPRPSSPPFPQPLAPAPVEKQKTKASRKKKLDGADLCDAECTGGGPRKMRPGKTSSRRSTLPADLSDEEDDEFLDEEFDPRIRKCSAPGRVDADKSNQAHGPPEACIGRFDYARSSPFITNGIKNSEPAETASTTDSQNVA